MTPAIIRNIPLLDLQAQHRQIREEVLAEMVRVVDSQKFILGEDVKALEAEIAAYSQTRYAIGCASGSDALILALMALDIKPGDEVLTTPYTFFATAGAISRLGALPVFVDVQAETFNIDANQVERVLDAHPKVRAIIPVHLFGGCADMDHIMQIADARRVPVIEDAAQSIGSEYKGRRAGSIGRIGCFSFFPSKNLGGYGDGGIISTNDEGLAQKLTALRVHGGKKKYYHEWIGMNSRLDALQAAILRVKLKYLDGWSAGRAKNAEYYRTRLATLGVPVTPLKPVEYQTRHIYNQFVIRSTDRDLLRGHLKSQGIGTEVYYPIPLHLQPCYGFLGHKPGDFPVSEQLAAESLSLPVHSDLPLEDIDYVCDSMKAYYA